MDDRLFPRQSRSSHKLAADRRLRAASILLLAWAGLSCAGTQRPGLLTDSQWRQALAERGVGAGGLQNPLLASEAMRREAQRAAGGGSTLEQLGRLQKHLFDESRFVFDYFARETRAAAEAFETRRSNCVSCTNLFIALARSLDIPVQAALAQVPRQTETLGDLVVVNSHIVALYRHSKGRTVYDFDRNRGQRPLGYQSIGDLELTAIYLNNLGAEKLIARQAAAAIRFFEDAARLAPDLAASHLNLGVALERQGEVGAALDAYLLALQIEPRDLSTRNNLRNLFSRMAEGRRGPSGDPGGESGEDPEHRDAANLLARGDLELAAGRSASAFKHYRQALRLDRSRADPYVALARAELLKGRVGRARKRLETALHLDPQHVDARRLLTGLEQPRDRWKALPG